MAIAMVAMLAFGGTYAYFTSSTAAATSDAVKTATIMLQNNAAVTLSTTADEILPGEKVSMSATITDASTRDSYVFVNVKLTGVPATATLTLSDPEGWTKYENADEGTTVYYKEITAKDTVSLESEGTFVAEDKSVNGEAGDLMGVDITVTARFASAQKGGDVADVNAAYAAVKADLAIA